MNSIIKSGNPLEGLDWGVKELPLQTADGMTVPHRAIVQEVTGELLGVVGSDYVVHDHRPTILRAFDLLTKYGTPAVKHTVNGGRIYTDLILPVARGEVSPKFRVTNTYDGSSSLRVTLGLFQLICSNGMGRWVESSRFARKHTAMLEASDIESAMGALPELMGRYDHLRTRLLDVAPPTVKEFGEAVGVKIAERITGQPLAETLVEADRPARAMTAWDLFNASTRFITRAEVTEARRDQIHTIIESFFLPLAGVKG